MTDDFRRTAARWRTDDSSPLGTYARTGVVEAGIDVEIGEHLAVVRRGGLDHIGVDPLEEVGDLRALLEHVRPELAKRTARTEQADVAADPDQTTRVDRPSVRGVTERRTLEVRIVDRDALGGPTPQAIRHYLAARGWRRDLSEGRPPEVWALSTAEGRYEVLAPISQEFRDYALRVADLVGTVSAAEGRSELDVLRDLDPPGLHGRLPVVAGTSEILHQIADARREYAEPPASRENRTVILHEASVLSAVAEALAGRSRWSDLVGSYAPSWRWHEFGEHDPAQSFPWMTDQREAIVASTETAPRAPGPGPTWPYIRPVGDDRGTPPGWVVEPIGRWRGDESEVVYDRRRYDVTVSGRSAVPWDEKYVTTLRAGGWEQHTTDGRGALWVLDRVTSARNALARCDERAAGVGVDPPEVGTRPSAPEVEL